MGRHARPSWAGKTWAVWRAGWKSCEMHAGAAERVRHGATSRRGVFRLRTLHRGWGALALAAAAAGIYGLVLVMARPHPGRLAGAALSGTVSSAGAAGVSSSTAAASASAASAVTPGDQASAVASAEPTPPAVSEVSLTSSAGTMPSRTAPVSIRNGGASPRPTVRSKGGSGMASATGTLVNGGRGGSARSSVSAGNAAHSSNARLGTGSPAGSSSSLVAAAAVPPAQGPPSLQAPVSGAVLAGFGWAYSPVFGDWQEHAGIDLAASIGQRVVAPAAGAVLAVRRDSLWGWVVSIALGDGYSTNVSALGSVSVRSGQAIHSGEVIGAVGSSPPAESNLGPHVFWQLFSGSRPLNPLGG